MFLKIKNSLSTTKNKTRDTKLYKFVSLFAYYTKILLKVPIDRPTIYTESCITAKYIKQPLKLEQGNYRIRYERFTLYTSYYAHNLLFVTLNLIFMFYFFIYCFEYYLICYIILL